MSNLTANDELEEEIQRGRYVRAVELARSLNIPPEKLRGLQEKALWHMAAVCRNRPGTKKLADNYKISKSELKEILDKFYQSEKENAQFKRYLDPCYDQASGKYLSFEEWKEELIKRWNKI